MRPFLPPWWELWVMGFEPGQTVRKKAYINYLYLRSDPVYACAAVGEPGNFEAAVKPFLIIVYGEYRYSLCKCPFKTYCMKILVVDDETDVKFLFEQHFRKEIRSREMEFMFAFSGLQALEYLEQHNHEAVLILSDINMPGMSGLQLLKSIKENYESPSPHVIMVTAYGDDESYNHAMQSGANGFLTKPVNFGVLREHLKTVGNA